MLLVCSLLVSVTLMPVSAADPELYYQDILLDAVYSCYDDDRLVSSTKETPTHFYSGSTTAKFQWDARHYDRTYTSIIYTVYFSVDPGIDNVISEFHHYNGRVTKASAVQLDTYYYQFRIDRTSNMSWPAIEFTFTKAYSGTISILSCFGVRDIGTPLDSVNWQQYGVYIPYKDPVVTQDLVKSEVGVSLPISHMSRRTDQYQSWHYDIIAVSGDFGGASSLDSLTFLTEGFLCEAVTFSIIGDNVRETEHIIEVENLATKVTTSYPSWGENAWEVYAQQLTVDLKGYDLKNCNWEMTFSVDPLSFNSTMSFTYWCMYDIIARLPVENTPWYKTFFSWLSVKWDNVTSSIVTEIKNVGKKLDGIVVSPSVQEHLNDAAGEMDSKKEQINEYNDRFQDLEKPEISGSSLIDPVLPGNALGLTVMTTLANQDIIARLILAVFSFSLMGYVMFGKR